jgi:hypothetical protein
LSFQDNNFVDKSKNSFGDVNELNNEINAYFEHIKIIRRDKIKPYTLDNQLLQSADEYIAQRASNVGKVDVKIEIKLITEALYDIENLNENEILFLLTKLITILNQDSTISISINYFIKTMSTVHFINILNDKNINNKILHLHLHIVNKLISSKEPYLDEIITFQYYFYVSKLIHIFQDLEIKIELLFTFYYLFQSNINLLKNFLTSGGFFIIPHLLDSSLVKSFDLLILVTLTGLFKVLQLFYKKFEEYAEIFLNNKLLTRLNIILFEIFSDEIYLENDNCCLIVEKIMDILIKLTEVIFC